MDFLDAELESEYRRWVNLVGESDPYNGRTTMGIHDVLRAHFMILDHFKATGGEGFGGVGPRDLNLLHSALSRQHISFDGIPKYSEDIELCATLFFGIAKNHAFHDANKRTALLVALYHLYRIGRCPSDNMKQKELDNIAVCTAEGSLNRYPEYERFKRRHAEDADVMFLAHWFRRHTRKINTRDYFVTYHELNRLLSRFRCRLANPAGNFIDVLATRDETLKTLWIFKQTKPVEKKVAQVGFPGWKKQVNPSAIATIRKACGLTPEQGVDSQVFFKGVDIIDALIDKFNGPLRRLANK